MFFFAGISVLVHLFCSFRENELFLPSFHAQYGYKNKFCAADVVRACEALLESVVSPLKNGITPDVLRPLPRKNTLPLIHKIETGLIL